MNNIQATSFTNPLFNSQDSSTTKQSDSFSIDEPFWKNRPKNVIDQIIKEFANASRERTSNKLYRGYAVLDSKEYTYGEVGEEGYQTSYNFLAKVRKSFPNKKAKVLDVGSGEGKFLESIMFSGSIEAYGLSAYDFRDDDSKIPRYFLGNAELIIEEQKKLGLPGQFNGIISHYAFMHFVDPLGTLSQFYSLLEKDGILLVDTCKCYGLNGYLPEFINFMNEQGYKISAGFTVGGNKNGKFSYLQIEKTHDNLNFPVKHLWFQKEGGFCGYKIDHSFIPEKDESYISSDYEDEDYLEWLQFNGGISVEDEGDSVFQTIKPSKTLIAT